MLVGTCPASQSLIEKYRKERNAASSITNGVAMQELVGELIGKDRKDINIEGSKCRLRCIQCILYSDVYIVYYTIQIQMVSSKWCLCIKPGFGPSKSKKVTTHPASMARDCNIASGCIAMYHRLRNTENTEIYTENTEIQLVHDFTLKIQLLQIQIHQLWLVPTKRLMMYDS